MKKMLAFLLASALCCMAYAQSTIQPLLPASGTVQKTQLWNVIIVNTAGAGRCKLELTVRDQESGGELFTASTKTFQLENGVTQLNQNALLPIEYNELQSMGIMRSGNFLPAGRYTVCYRLIAIDRNKLQLAEECAALDVQPLSPPMLATPADSSVLDVQPGQFTWLPPSPVTMFQNLRYEVILVEVLSGQKAEEAIEQNVPVHIELNAKTNVLNYAAVNPLLQKDKTYAWQVVAIDGLSYSARSEVWSFRLSAASSVDASANNVYIMLVQNKAEAAMNTIPDHKLFINYYSYDKAHESVVSILDAEGEVIQEFRQTISYGKNLFNLRLKNSFQRGKIYTIRIMDKQNKTYTGFFNILNK